MKIMLLGAMASGKSELIQRAGLPHHFKVVASPIEQLKHSGLTRLGFWWQYYFVMGQLRSEAAAGKDAINESSGINIMAFNNVKLYQLQAEFLEYNFKLSEFDKTGCQFFYCPQLPEKYLQLSEVKRQFRDSVDEQIQKLIKRHHLNFVELSGSLDQRLATLFNYVY